MESYDPEELTSKVKQEQEETSNLAVETVQWFLDEDHVGELYPRGDAVQEIAEYLGVPVQKASDAISSIVSDIVDPVQQIVTREGKFVGAIGYKVFNDEGAYGYIHFDDRLGKRKRVVCARCVEKETLDENISHATQGEGTSNVDATWQQLLNKVTSHYADAHTQAPEDIEPGASLLDGTTIAGNDAHHSGNYSAPVQSVNSKTGDVSISTDAPVDDVNGQTGSVNLDYNDVGALASSDYNPEADTHSQPTGTQSGGKAGGIVKTAGPKTKSVNNNTLATFNFQLDGQVSDETFAYVSQDDNNSSTTIDGLRVFTDEGGTVLADTDPNTTVPEGGGVEVSVLHDAAPIGEVEVDLGNGAPVSTDFTVEIRNRIPSVASHDHQI